METPRHQPHQDTKRSRSASRPTKVLSISSSDDEPHLSSSTPHPRERLSRPRHSQRDLRSLLDRRTGPHTPTRPPRSERSISRGLDSVDSSLLPDAKRRRIEIDDQTLSRRKRQGKRKYLAYKHWVEVRGRHDILNLIGYKLDGQLDPSYFTQLLRKVIALRYKHWMKRDIPKGRDPWEIEIPFHGRDNIPEIPKISSPKEYDPSCGSACCWFLRDANVAVTTHQPPIHSRPHRPAHEGIGRSSSPSLRVSSSSSVSPKDTEALIREHYRKIEALKAEQRRQLGSSLPPRHSSGHNELRYHQPSSRPGPPKHRWQSLLETPPNLSTRDLERLVERSSDSPTYIVHRQRQLAAKAKESTKPSTSRSYAARQIECPEPSRLSTKPTRVYTPSQRQPISLSTYRKRSIPTATATSEVVSVLHTDPIHATSVASAIAIPDTPVSPPKGKRHSAQQSVASTAFKPTVSATDKASKPKKSKEKIAKKRDEPPTKQ